MTASNELSIIIRTDRGLTIAKTRITLYDVMDYFTAGYPAKLIREKLRLTDAQVQAAISYIEAHRAEVEAEYQQVLQIAEDDRQYWENAIGNTLPVLLQYLRNRIKKQFALNFRLGKTGLSPKYEFSD